MRIIVGEVDHNPTAEEAAEHIAAEDSVWQSDFLYQLMRTDMSTYTAKVQANFIATEFVIDHGERAKDLIDALDFFKELLIERMRIEGK